MSRACGGAYFFGERRKLSDPAIVVHGLGGVGYQFVAGRNFNFWRTLDVETPADQAPIQLETLSPVASHDLFASVGSAQ